MVYKIKGRDFLTGLPRTAEITTNEVVKAIDSELKDMMKVIKNVLQETPPELSSDIIDNGITLTGGSSLLRNLDELVFRSTGVKARVADDALLCVAKGAGLALDHLDTYKKALSPRGSFMHPILKVHIEKREFSHAYLLCGEAEMCKKQAFEVADAILNTNTISRQPLDIRANPDFYTSGSGYSG